MEMSRPSVLSNPGYHFRLRPNVDEDPFNFRYRPFVRNGGSRDSITSKMFLTLPIPRGRLDCLYKMCVSTYAEFGRDAFHPRFREVYDSFMDELIASQLHDFDIEGYIQLCVEDLFEKDIFVQRRNIARPNVRKREDN
jgi:hypothetical protein